MEFLRFGSSIPGSYWGCCAVCIIQDFKQDPDDPYAIELVSGDGGEPLDGKFLGKTYREVFDMRMRIGTFNTDEMPNHAFLAVLTDWQLSSNVGRKWLKILKEHGFEFIRTVDNSVYTGSRLKCDVSDDDDEYYGEDTHPNYLFGLFRNIGAGAVDDPFKPPQEWLDLEGGVLETWEYLREGDAIDPRERLQESRDAIHLAKWQETETTFYTREELEKENIPIWLAGRRSPNPQELAKYREERQKKNTAGGEAPVAAPFKAGGL